jgi:repressor LexA
MSFGSRLKELRIERGMTQKELGDKLNISDRVIGYYESEDRFPKDEKTLKELSDIFDVSIDYLLGNTPTQDKQSVRIKVYGTIPAGIPIEAIEDVQGWEEIPKNWLKGGKEYIALKVQGDSMYPKYLEGDIVVILLQPDCESGQDCACYVNGYNATLKTITKGDSTITLTPINPNYAPQTYDHPGQVKILGVVKELRRKIS